MLEVVGAARDSFTPLMKCDRSRRESATLAHTSSRLTSCLLHSIGWFGLLLASVVVVVDAAAVSAHCECRVGAECVGGLAALPVQLDHAPRQMILPLSGWLTFARLENRHADETVRSSWCMVFVVRMQETCRVYVSCSALVGLEKKVKLRQRRQQHRKPLHSLILMPLLVYVYTTIFPLLPRALGLLSDPGRRGDKITSVSQSVGRSIKLRLGEGVDLMSFLSTCVMH